MERKPEIMAIVNLTDDSFFASSRSIGSDGQVDVGMLASRVGKMLEDGADMIDLGACSTRPGSLPVAEDVEWQRLLPALKLFAEEFPGVRLSIDTFRPGIVEKAYGIVGPFIVNDVSGGHDRMLQLVGELGLTYVAMHTKGSPADMMQFAEYENVTKEVSAFFEDFALKAARFGIKDWILDPGFGFAKTVGHNWQLLREMSALKVFGRKILAGVSRKSFLYKPLGITPEKAGTATQVANFMAIVNGAEILRVHDVAPAVQTVKMAGCYQNPV